MLTQVNVLGAVSQSDRDKLSELLSSTGSKVWAPEEPWESSLTPDMDMVVVEVDDIGRVKGRGLDMAVLDLQRPVLGLVERSTPEDARILALKEGVMDLLERPLTASAVLARVGLISQCSRIISRFKAAGMEDQQTGLPSRSYFMMRLEQELQRSRRHGEPLAVAAIGLDLPEDVPEQIGWPETARLLLRVARMLDERLRSYDVAARLGPLAFGAALWSCEEESAVEVCKTLRRRVKDSMLMAGPLGFLTISVGIAMSGTGDTVPVVGEITARAVGAMKAAADAGGDRVALFR